jgi:hypothetical protein
MRLIVSAFKVGASQTENTLTTGTLINACREFTLDMVQGCYDGVQEVALQLTDFTDIEHLHRTAANLCEWFGQSCVYYSIDGIGSLLHADGRHETIGAEREYPAEMVHSGLFRSIYKNYTVYSDGSAIAAKHVLKAAA